MFSHHWTGNWGWGSQQSSSTAWNVVLTHAYTRVHFSHRIYPAHPWIYCATHTCTHTFPSLLHHFPPVRQGGLVTWFVFLPYALTLYVGSDLAIPKRNVTGHQRLEPLSGRTRRTSKTQKKRKPPPDTERTKGRKQIGAWATQRKDTNQKASRTTQSSCSTTTNRKRKIKLSFLLAARLYCISSRVFGPPFFASEENAPSQISCLCSRFYFTDIKILIDFPS